ncbi:phosphotransferase [Clostridium perfringens]|nr:phosphotransferase [Clostridium perfringens]
MERELIKNKEELQSLVDTWGINKDLDIKEEYISYETKREPHIWSVGEDYILKMTNIENEMKNNVYISKLLLKGDVPAQKVVETSKGEFYISLNNKYYGLFTKIKGEVLKDYFEGDYVKRGFYLGECAAKLHKGLKTITEEVMEKEKIWDNNMIEELNGWVKEEIDKYLPQCILSEEEIDSFNNIRRDLSENFEELYLKLPRQVIHRDFHGENMIFQNEELVGYIDFDLTQINARIFDVCYLCTGSLASVFQNEDKRNKWIDFSKSVIEGYKSNVNITVEEKRSLKYMILSIELIMIAFFVKEGYKDIADINIKMVSWINSVWDK